jgi:hypothetical protein
MEYRPQAAFLPQAPNRGTTPILPQRVLKRSQAEQKAKLVKKDADNETPVASSPATAL